MMCTRVRAPKDYVAQFCHVLTNVITGYHIPKGATILTNVW